MERDSTGTTKNNDPASPVRIINEDTCADKSHSSRVETCGNTHVARARWTLLRQVMCALRSRHKPLRDSDYFSSTYFFYNDLNVKLEKVLHIVHHHNCGIIEVRRSYYSSQYFSLSCFLPNFVYKAIGY